MRYFDKFSIVSGIILGTFLVAGSFGKPAQAENLEDCKLGWRAIQDGRSSLAITLFDKCMAEGELSNANLARTYRNRGIANRERGSLDQSIEDFTRALELEPEDKWDDYVNRGNSWSDKKQFDKALQDYETALKFRPNYAPAIFNRGIAFERLGERTLAAAAFHQAAALGYRSPELANRLKTYGLTENNSNTEPQLTGSAASEGPETASVPEEVRNQLPPPPEGFVWRMYKNVLFIKPDQWHEQVRDESSEKITLKTYAASAENFSASKPFETGMTVQIMSGFKTSTKIPARELALLYVKPSLEKLAAGPKEDVLIFDNKTNGTITNVVLRYRDAPTGMTPIVIHKFLVANNATDSVHIFIFESPETNWNENFERYGVPFMRKLNIVFQLPPN